MSATASIAQEFYKVRDEWARVDKLKSWRLAIWVAQFQDIEIIDKFLETERLPVGAFDDIFFRFDTEFKGNIQEFEQSLWKEYESWFATPPAEKYDMLLALINDGLLDPDFKPQFQPESGFENLLSEMLRFKASIKGLEKEHFCLYFPPTRPETNIIGNWLKAKLLKDIPNGIRLVTIDYAADRKIEIHLQKLIPFFVEITPNLNMLAAINNEMDKGGGSSNTVSIDERYRKQIRVVMNSTLKNDVVLTSKEVKTMLSYSKQIGSPSAVISALLIASQAHFGIKDHEQSEQYADEAIVKADAAMKQNDPAGYPTWKSCMLLKGALLAGKRKWEKAITVYDQLADTATKHGDAYFIMEGHRISGHLYYLRGRLQLAFEKLLLAMVAGSYLEKNIIRQSTFLHAAHLAAFIGERNKTPEEVSILESQLQDWIGDDWKELLAEGSMENSTIKVSNFSFSIS